MPPSFYVLSPIEMKILFESQKAQTKALENTPLRTLAMREQELRLKEQKHPKTLIRVRFPDSYVLQAKFFSGDKRMKFIY